MALGSSDTKVIANQITGINFSRTGPGNSGVAVSVTAQGNTSKGTSVVIEDAELFAGYRNS
jgi:hypothetical protein